MAIKLKVETNEVKLKIADPDRASLKAHEGIPIYPNPYEGITEVTPSAETQTLQTNGLMLQANITINPIPSNYGLITWTGSTITVS